jgi:hypothetical protein
VLQWPIGVLAVANTMSPHTCLAGILFALDQHLDSTRLEGDVGENGEQVARCRTTVNGRRGLPEEIKHLQDVRVFELWAATRTAESRNRVAEGRTEQWIYNRGYERCSRGICQLLQIEIQRRRCLRCQNEEEEEEERGGKERSEEERLAP